MTQAPPELPSPRTVVDGIQTTVHPDIVQGGLSPRRLLIVLGPVLALVGFTLVLALAAWWLEGQRTEILVAAAGAGGIIVALTTFLLYRQVAGRQVEHQALQESRARVEAIFETAMDAVISIDEGQRVVLFNAAAEKVFRWRRGAVIGQPLGILLPERLREAHAAHIGRFGGTGVTSRRMGAQMALMGLRANGEEFPLEASISQHTEGSRRFYTVILRDITERVRAEDMLARSEARLRAILDSAMDGIVTVDAAQHIVLFNAAAETMFGCPREHAIGAPLAWFIPERFRDTHAAHIRQFGEAGTTSRRMGGLRVVTGQRRNGEEFPIDASISQLSEDGHKFYTVILRDVTERVRAEQALLKSKEELQLLALAAHQTREQEQSRIARELHDELGQSLTALKMLVASVRETVAQDDGASAEKLDKMGAVLDRTVAATRRIAADLRPLMLDDLGLIPAIEWLAEDFTQRNEIPCALAFDDPELKVTGVHATAIFRIVQEALTNVARHAKAGRVELRIAHEHSHVRIRIRDDGVGFATDAPRAPNSRGLLGMRERAYLLGGTIGVESSPGRGTIIEVRLPVGPAAAQS
jgi:hypothetical protein